MLDWGNRLCTGRSDPNCLYCTLEFCTTTTTTTTPAPHQHRHHCHYYYDDYRDYYDHDYDMTTTSSTATNTILMSTTSSHLDPEGVRFFLEASSVRRESQLVLGSQHAIGTSSAGNSTP